jgi:hypothetical protein
LIELGGVTDAQAFAKDFRAAIAMLAANGGPQWKRWHVVAKHLGLEVAE